MSLKGALDVGPTRKRKGPPCTVGVLLQALPETEADALADMLADSAWQGTQIARLVTRETGVTVQGGIISRHRRGDCACEPR